MSLFDRLYSCLRQHCGNKAFFIRGTSYGYDLLETAVTAVRSRLKIPPFDRAATVAVVANDDLETYAAVIACWFEGRTYVPILPGTPNHRMAEMLQLSGSAGVLDSSGLHGLRSAPVHPRRENQMPVPFAENGPVYILFTSGSTGRPKAVPITMANLTGFVDAVDAMAMELHSGDRWLQMFDLTFDLSVFSFLIPLLRGACVYTVPKTGIRYQQIFRLLDEHQLSVTLMVPSVLEYFRPYFDEIRLPALRYSLFCGEALPVEMAKRWQHAAEESKLYNVYGPCEATIFCTSYLLPKAGQVKSFNGVVSIGRPMKGTAVKILDDSYDESRGGRAGELCLGGAQITPGYLDGPAKNELSFIRLKQNESPARFYKTGDLCSADEQGDIYFRGRTDNQVKIQGFRVEPGEIEYHVRQFFQARNAVAVAWINDAHLQQIGVFIEGGESSVTDLLNYLKERLPGYMLPAKVQFIPAFPLNSNGKTDRLALQNRLKG